jgi:hypothetical protein
VESGKIQLWDASQATGSIRMAQNAEAIAIQRGQALVDSVIWDCSGKAPL